ncbi:MAG: lipopolysaccharide heptosyltransferase II [Candidatus Omnitrophica bacterium]|nr:lipopolysaccharide heptosyltransferase II [Candidatus Omnitrophota bacterium]
MNNILVVSVNWLGDAVFSTPVYRALKARYPGARVMALAVPRVCNVLAMCPDIDEVIPFHEKTLAGQIALAGQLRSKHVDAVFLLRRSVSRTFLMWLAGIPVRVGFAGNGAGMFLTHRVAEFDLDSRHRSDVYLKVLEAFGVPVSDHACLLSVLPEALLQADTWLAARGISSKDKILMVNTGGNWDLKQWPEKNFVGLVQALVRQEYKVILPGAASDKQKVERIIREAGVAAISAAGETDLKMLAGLLSRAQVLITADSGPLHLASALGVSTISLFGPTRPEITGPRGRGRSIVIQKDAGCNRAPCYNLQCQDNRCMKEIKVSDVCQALQQLEH